jgi:hypothetical protein
MRKIPYWVDGALFGTLFVPLIFLLKITCPIDIGCFADPFFIPVFSPLFLLENFFTNSSSLASPKFEIFFIVLFWGVVGSLLAHLWGKIVEHKT